MYQRSSLRNVAVVAGLGCVALFSLQWAIAQCPPNCGIAFTVDSTGDGPNVGPNTQCNDGTGHCTLRAAIQASNGHAGRDGIFFNLPINAVIMLTAALPAITAG